MEKGEDMSGKHRKYVRVSRLLLGSLLLTSLLVFGSATADAQTPSCNRTITADVVASAKVYTYNRFGAFNPAGMMYALRRDVSPITGATLSPGNVQLRQGKRPRPIVLRINQGDCLLVTFTNYLTNDRQDVDDINAINQPDKQTSRRLPEKLDPNDEPVTRYASIHVNGLDYVDGISSDGANVGQNVSSLAAPGQTRT